MGIFLKEFYCSSIFFWKRCSTEKATSHINPYHHFRTFGCRLTEVVDIKPVDATDIKHLGSKYNGFFCFFHLGEFAVRLDELLPGRISQFGVGTRENNCQGWF